MRHQPPNKIGRANRRPASALNAGRQIVNALRSDSTNNLDFVNLLPCGAMEFFTGEEPVGDTGIGGSRLQFHSTSSRYLFRGALMNSNRTSLTPMRCRRQALGVTTRTP
jgi:hypothetical protein